MGGDTSYAGIKAALSWLSIIKTRTRLREGVLKEGWKKKSKYILRKLSDKIFYVICHINHEFSSIIPSFSKEKREKFGARKQDQQRELREISMSETATGMAEKKGDGPNGFEKDDRAPRADESQE